jgi:triacylglycerol lipase
MGLLDQPRAGRCWSDESWSASQYLGSTHFEKVAFVFHKIENKGYTNAVPVDPFANEPLTFVELSIMSWAWVCSVEN